MKAQTPGKLKTYLMSDSWAWNWVPSIPDQLSNDAEFFTSSRYQHLTESFTPNGYPTLRVFLEAHDYTVTMIGNPGSSNRFQIAKLDRQLQHQGLLCEKNPELMIFLQTDPLRDLDHGQVYSDQEMLIERPETRMISRTGLKNWSVQKFEETVQSLTVDAYTELFKVITHHRLHAVPLLILGGCGTVDRELVQSCANQAGYYNAHVVSENILSDLHQILHGGTPEKFHPCYMNRIEDLVDQSWNPELVEHLYQISYKTQVPENPHYNLYTFPDTVHLNANSTMMMVELINQYVDKLGL